MRARLHQSHSILIDEARIPLVVAGGDSDGSALAYVADQVARQFQAREHYTVDVGEHNAALTDAGIRLAEEALACGNLFDQRNLRLHTALQEALNAHFSYGEPEAGAGLMKLTYRELRKIAAGHMRRERSARSLQTTALVHEAYLWLVNQDSRCA